MISNRRPKRTFFSGSRRDRRPRSIECRLVPVFLFPNLCFFLPRLSLSPFYRCVQDREQGALFPADYEIERERPFHCQLPAADVASQRGRREKKLVVFLIYNPMSVFLIRSRDSRRIFFPFSKLRQSLEPSVSARLALFFISLLRMSATHDGTARSQKGD